RPGRAVLLQVRRVLHLPRQGDRRRGAHGSQLRAQPRGGRGRLRAHLPVAPAHRARGHLLRRALMARTRSAGYDDQRETILARAAELFAQRGHGATSMNNVAEACGVSKPTLYHYYRDKYDLLVNIAEEHVTRLAEVVREVEAEGLPAEARLRQLILRFVGEYAGAQNAHRVLTED